MKSDNFIGDNELQFVSSEKLIEEILRRDGPGVMALLLKKSLDHVQRVCFERDISWVNKGNPAGTFSIMERGAELCEEAGEASGNAKKIRRLELGMRGNRMGKSREQLMGDLEYEIGDVLVTSANLANSGKVSLYNGLMRAFNERSESMQLAERL